MKTTAAKIIGILVAVSFAFLSFNETEAQQRLPDRFKGKSRKGMTASKRRKGPLSFGGWKRATQGKLIGGITNIISAPVEIPAAILRQTKRRGKAKGTISGAIDGLSNMVRRAGAGLTDVATFPTRFPNNNYRNTMAPKGPIKLFRDSTRGRFAYRR